MPDDVVDGLEAIEGFEDLPADHPVKKALISERNLREAAERTVKVQAVLAKFPTAGLSADDVQGLSLDKIEAIATRLAETANPGAAAPTIRPEPDATTEEPSPTETAFATAARISEGTPPPTQGKKLNRDEAFALMKRNPAEYERLKAAGRIDIGVTLEDQGGKIIFTPST